MKFKVQSSKFTVEVGGRSARLLGTSNFELRTSRQRRASVLVLVMTLLGILFVLGVAFLASMNFEADMIVSETQRHRADSRVAAAVDQLGSTLRDGLMSDSRMPFGNPSAALSATSFAEMPGVQNSFSAIEPHWELNQLVFSPYTDVVALKKHPFTGPSLPQGFAIDTSLPNGGMITNLPTGAIIKGKCLGGINKGVICDYVPSECPGSVCEGPRVLDADGDGIVDSLQVDASVLDFSDAQLAALSARLNPPSNPTGKVYVGMRVLPHGGLVNLNAAHPKLIENVLDVPDLRFTPNPAEYGNFVHRPTRYQVAYSPLLEEPTLRRRGFLAPRAMPPSWLHGDPLLDPVNYPTGKADMQWQLFPPIYPDGAANNQFETVFKHRYWAFSPSWGPTDPNTEWYNPGNTDLGTLWAVRMEPFTSAKADVTGHEYDRRHLVTTVSHDDLLARGGRVPNPNVTGGEEDVLTKMTQANQTAWLPAGEGCPVLLPFEYPDYPQTIANPPDANGAPCCPTDLSCKLNARKGRLQLSLPYLDDQIAVANKLTDPKLKQEAFDRIFRVIHDAFFLLVRNAARVTTLEGTPCASNVDCTYANAVCGAGNRCTVAPPPPTPFNCTSAANCSIPGSVCRTTDGVCTIQAPYWQDVQCPATACAAGEVCNTLGLCVDAWTGQSHSQALISRTAAALTANLIDYADLDDIPTRIALRSFDFAHGVCVKGANSGRACDKDADCTGGGANSCLPPAMAAGREFDFDPGPTFKPEYVYGLERQPYITEVATLAIDVPPPVAIAAEAIELFNPYDVDIDANGYFIIEVDGGGVIKPSIALSGMLPARSFTVFASGDPAKIQDLTLPATPKLLPTALQFGNGWTIYLVRGVIYDPGVTTDIVVDQFHVVGNCVGVSGAAYPLICKPPPQRHSVERVVATETTKWTAPIALDPPVEQIGNVSLGTWNNSQNNALHPVEVNFANLGSFSRPFPMNPPDPRNGSVSFPTTGSLLMLMRHANRSFPKPGKPFVKELAFTTHLVGDTTIKNPANGATIAIISAEKQIDNGRMPIFDVGARSATPTDPQFYPAHHVSASTTHLDAPGNLDTLPWGQLVFDYFTALPLSNPGPYVDSDPGPEVVVASPDSLPRVDLEGLRVHGRININAAPWKVLSGLPFVPMQKIPVPYKARIRRSLGFVKESAAANWLAPTAAELDVHDDEAARIGTELAQAIVAYRELRTIPGFTGGPGTGNYADGTPTVPPTLPAIAPVAYARGWNSTAPMARRGTGFMTVGELANVRHLGAEAINPALPVGFPKSYYRIDAGVIGVSSGKICATDMECLGGEVCMSLMCIRMENFVDAVAGLVALGDWVTVRSHVFTVYGVLRGEEDSTIVDPSPLVQQKLRTQDADSRALRFQETIDRLPTFLGEPIPSRIGDRTLTRYTDVQND